MHDHNVMLIGDICTTQTGSRTEASQEGQNNLETVGSSGYPRQQARNRESHRSTRGGARHGCTSERGCATGSGPEQGIRAAAAVRGRAVRPIQSSGRASSAFLLVFAPNALDASRPGSSTPSPRTRTRLRPVVEYCSGPALRHLSMPFLFRNPPAFSMPSLSPSAGVGPVDRAVPCVERINNDWRGPAGPVPPLALVRPVLCFV
jgi:hypothetical protein